MAREISLAPTAAVAAAEPAAAPARVRRRRQLHLFSVAADAHEIISLQNTIPRMFHQEAEEPTDDEGAAGKKQGMARDSDEVSPGCRGADGRCSRRWKEARNRALSRRIHHDGEKPVDGARAGGRKRVITRGGERF
uniref:Uncharacterized protein n=1 Tax=Oryza nivara TaxID=4536 RepID=A0A0E0ILK8_ORYNI